MFGRKEDPEGRQALASGRSSPPPALFICPSPRTCRKALLIHRLCLCTTLTCEGCLCHRST